MAPFECDSGTDRALLARLALPVVLLQLLMVSSLILGAETLYLRDVLHTHLTGVESVADSFGWLGPEVLDRSRGGGQPLAGNPNFLPFYPTTLLRRGLDPLWALNAHFWLHFLLMPWAFYAMARRFRMGVVGAWSAATFYTFSGFALSQFTYYNLMPAVSWGPLVVACWVGLHQRLSPWRILAAGGSWALLLLGGGPILALWVGLATLLALGMRGSDSSSKSRTRPSILLGTAFGGTLLAAPQWVEFARVLPTSFRAVQGYGDPGAVGRFQPSQLLDWVLPTLFGRIDRLGIGAFWGQDHFGGALPFFLTLAPGGLVLLLWWVGPGRGWGARWGAGCVALGGAVSVGLFQPLASWLPGGVEGLVRFPVKAWLLVALGGALLAGLAFERLASGIGTARRRAWTGWAAWTLLIAALGWALSAGVADGVLVRPDGMDPALWVAERARWPRLGLVALGLSGALGVLMALVPRRSRWALPALLVLFSAGQIWQLRSVVARDQTVRYRPPAVQFEWPPSGVRAVHAGVSRWPEWRALDGPSIDQGPAAILARRAALEHYPFVAITAAGGAGVHWELNPSPEGLDSYLTYLALDATRRLPLGARSRLLQIWGIGALLDRPGLQDERLRPVWEGPAESLVVGYAIEDPVPEVRLVSGVRFEPSPGPVLQRLLSEDFDPRREVVVLGSGDPGAPGAGRVAMTRASTWGLEVQTQAERSGFLVVQQTFHPVYRASVDGVEASVRVADLHRLAIPVPAGDHRVRLWVERGPRFGGWATSLVGLLLLVLLGRSRRPPWAGRAEPRDASV